MAAWTHRRGYSLPRFRVRVDREPDLLAQPARLVAPLQDDVAALVVVAPRTLVAQHLVWGETVCAHNGDGGVQGGDDRLEAPGVALRASFGLLWGVRGEGRTRIRHRVPGLRPGCRVYRWGFGLAFGVRAPCTQQRRG